MAASASSNPIGTIHRRFIDAPILRDPAFLSGRASI
jgi:hypothetical protein